MKAAAVIAATLAAVILATTVLIYDGGERRPATPGSVAPTTTSTTPAWRTDLPAAREEAAAAGKDVLIEFTVRNGPSVPEVDRTVYDTERFLAAASDRFVPVRLSVSTDPSSGATADVSVIALAQRLELGRIPALVLADAAGRPYASVESSAATVEAHLELIGEAVARRTARDDALARASQAQGLERATWIAQALDHTGRFAAADEYEHLAHEAASLDRENRLGLRDRYAVRQAAARIDHAVQTRVYPAIDRADFSGAIAVIDQLVASDHPTTEQAQVLTAFKAELLVSLGRRTDAAHAFDAALNLAPAGPTAARIRESRARLLD